MKRINVTTWADGEVLTKHMSGLQLELMKYQKHASHREDGLWGVGKLDGDSSVMIAAIMLRDRLDALIEKSRKANEVRSTV